MSELMDSNRILLCTDPYQGSVGSSAVAVWRNKQLLKVIERYEPVNTYSGDEAGLFFMLPPKKMLSVKGNPCSGGKNSKDRMIVMLACNISATDGLSPLVVGKSEKSHCFKNVRNLHAKCGARSAMISVSLLREKVLCCPPSYLPGVRTLPAYSARPVFLFYLPAPPISPSHLPAFSILYPASRSAPRSPPSLLFGSVQVVCLCHEVNFSSLIHCSC
jgi:hypothetical protein